MIQPPQRLDSAPPVLFGCTRSEIGLVLISAGASGALLMIITWPLLWSLLDSGLTAFVIGFFASLMVTLLAAWIGVRSLGAMKAKGSDAWFAQRVERFKHRIGMGHPKLIVRVGRWQNLR